MAISFLTQNKKGQALIMDSREEGTPLSAHLYWKYSEEPTEWAYIVKPAKHKKRERAHLSVLTPLFLE